MRHGGIGRQSDRGPRPEGDPVAEHRGQLATLKPQDDVGFRPRGLNDGNCAGQTLIGQRQIFRPDAVDHRTPPVHGPTGYQPAKPRPLAVGLHGIGGTEDSFFDAYARVTPTLAEQHGFLLVAPLGYRVDGFYGSPLMGGGDAAARRRTELSEKDVLEVLARMKAQYAVDDSRIYLIGHSMGAIGTWALGAKYPDLWAALVPFSGVGSPAAATRMKAIPQYVVHGDADPTVNVSGSRTMVAALKAAGGTVTYVEVPGGNHTDVVVPQLPKAFEFLAVQKKTKTAATQQ